MGFDLEVSISAITVFLQGILSFFSPCVLPLVPLYIGYLSGGTTTKDQHGNLHYDRKKVMVNTTAFVIGVSFAFFLLGFGFSTAGLFLSSHQALLSRVGGILIILFGLYQLGVFGSSRFLAMDRRLPLRLDKLAMNPVTALVLGFTFSFAWTPCIGPALATVLLMAGSASSSALGYLFIGLFTLGFVLPFMAVGLFTGTLLALFKKHQNVMKYTVKIGGILMVLIGFMMLSGFMNTLSVRLSQLGNQVVSTVEVTPEPTVDVTPEPAVDVTPEPTVDVTPEPTVDVTPEPTVEMTPEPTVEATPEPTVDVTPEPTVEVTPEPTPEVNPEPESPIDFAPDFTLTDQFGNTHTLSDYRGKTVFLNFWATWCNPCIREMPDIQALYEEWGGNSGDLIILGVANPKTDSNPRNSDGTIDEVSAVLATNGWNYPTVMDTTGSVFGNYGITAFPTTFMIAPDGSVYGYVTGTLSRSTMDDIISQTMNG